MKYSGKTHWLLMTVAKTVPVVVAAVLYLVCLSRYLPFTRDLGLASDCIHFGGHAAPFVWRTLLKLSWHLLPGSVSFRLGLVSALAGVVAVWAYLYVLSRLLPYATAFARRNAATDDASYDYLTPLTTFFAGISFILAPGFFLGATRCAATTVCVALTILPFALASLCMDVERQLTRVYVIVAMGFVSGLATWEGVFGALALPFAFGAVWTKVVRDEISITKSCGLFLAGFVAATLAVCGDGLEMPSFSRTIPVVFWQILTLSLAPALLVYAMLMTKYLRKVWSRLIMFGIWAAVIVLMVRTNLRSHPMEYGRAANAVVNGAFAELQGRKWLVSDGKFDNLIRFMIPDGVRLVTYARKLDPNHGRELAAWAKADLKADDDLLLAAELGPVEFLDEWMRREGAVTNCVFMTMQEPIVPVARERFRPTAFCWVAEAPGRSVNVPETERRWDEAWESLKPAVLHANEPNVGLIRAWLAVQGNAIGCFYQDRQDVCGARRTYVKALEEMDRTNLSLLLNAHNLGRGETDADAHEADLVKGWLKSEMGGIRGVRMFRSRIVVGGRLYLSDEMRKQLKEWRINARAKAEDAADTKWLREKMARLAEVSKLTGDVREQALMDLESSMTGKLSSNATMKRFRNLILGEIHRLKGTAADLKMAQACFRKSILDDAVDVKLASDRLLLVSVALHNNLGLEYDAMLALHQDINHPLANALLGSARLERGECTSAVRFLRRAVKVGMTKPGVKNDLALALSGHGEHEEAERMIREVVKASPDSWHILDSMAEILAAAGKSDEAASVRERAAELAKQKGQYVSYEDMMEARERKRGMKKDGKWF